jgi:hypothetical protein
MEPTKQSCLDVGISDRLPINGQWRIQPNPYCATDRFFDQMIFDSYPRVQKQTSFDEKRSQILQKRRLRIQCRLYGHYTSGRIPFARSYARGKLSHGVLISSGDSNKSKGLLQRFPRVPASFKAERSIPSKDALTSLLDHYDKKIFGY